jgi:hypothetical protein
MNCVGEMVRKLPARLEVTSNSTHAYIFFDVGVPPFSPGWYYQSTMTRGPPLVPVPSPGTKGPLLSPIINLDWT